MSEEYPPLERWNYINLLLGQALLGSISANVRAISLTFETGQWMIRFILEAKDEEDVEALSEALTDFEAMDSSVAPYRFEFLESRDKIIIPSPPGRLIFQRRE